VKVTPIKGVPRAFVSNSHVEVLAQPSSFIVVHPVGATQSQTIVQRSIIHPFDVEDWHAMTS
jgi:phosphatidylserine decarboxylase